MDKKLKPFFYNPKVIDDLLWINVAVGNETGSNYWGEIHQLSYFDAISIMNYTRCYFTEDSPDPQKYDDFSYDCFEEIKKYLNFDCLKAVEFIFDRAIQPEEMINYHFF